MEPQFKTSFIPKQSLSQEAPSASPIHHSKPHYGLGAIFAFLLLLITGAVAGGVFFFKSTIQAQIDDKLAQLEVARQQFQPALIKELERLDIRIASAQEILSEHIANSQLFSLLEGSTLKSVRFNKMDLLKQNDGSLLVELSGEALNFESVALQSDVLVANRFVRQPVISDLGVEEREDGSTFVIFTVTAQIDPRFMTYSNAITGGEENNASSAFDAPRDIQEPVN